MTIGNPVLVAGLRVTNCDCSSSANCGCCCTGNHDVGNLPKDSCCKKIPAATSPRSCCSSIAAGKTTAESPRTSIVDQSIAKNGCACVHGIPESNAPPKNQSVDNRNELPDALVSCNVAALKRVISVKPISKFGFDPGLALMTHSRRLSLHSTWLK